MTDPAALVLMRAWVVDGVAASASASATIRHRISEKEARNQFQSGFILVP
jgi:hypothetical protein